MYEDASAQFLSENIEESPFKKDKRMNEKQAENNIKHVQKVQVSTAGGGGFFGEEGLIFPSKKKPSQ